MLYVFLWKLFFTMSFYSDFSHCWCFLCHWYIKVIRKTRDDVLNALEEIPIESYSFQDDGKPKVKVYLFLDNVGAIGTWMSQVCPPNTEWRENIALAVKHGGIEAVTECIKKHGGNEGLLLSATKVFMYTMWQRYFFTSKVFQLYRMRIRQSTTCKRSWILFLVWRRHL